MIEASSLTQIDAYYDEDFLGPTGFFIAPSADHALILRDDLSTIGVFDLNTLAIDEIDIGGDPTYGLRRRPVWSKDGATVYVPLYRSDNSVAVLYRPQPDITGPYGRPDGFVDVLDLLAVLSAWGPCP